MDQRISLRVRLSQCSCFFGQPRYRVATLRRLLQLGRSLLTLYQLPYTYHRHGDLPAASTPFAASGTGANTFTSATTGANGAFVFNSNGTSPTGDLADFQLSGSTKALIGNAGNGSFVGVAVGGALSTATTGAFSGTITDSATSSQLTFSNPSSGALITSAQPAAFGFQINASTTSTSSSMFNVANNGTEEWQVGFNGNTTQLGSGTFHGVAVGGALSTATTGAFSQPITLSAAPAQTNWLYQVLHQRLVGLLIRHQHS